MKKGNGKLLLILWAVAALLVSGCGSGKKEVTAFIVEEEYQLYTVADRFSYDLRMPKVADEVEDSEIINGQIRDYDDRKAEDWPEMQPLEEQKPTLVYIERTYLVNNQEGVCGLTILTRWVPSAEGAEAGFSMREEAVSFYYDENRGRAIDQEQYLTLLSMSKAQLLAEFKEEYGEQYSDRAYTADDLMWYYNEHGELKFITDPIDSMTADAGDFILTVGEVPFGLGGDYEFPEERGQAFDIAFEEETETGISWQTEQYEGVKITYVTDTEAGERSLYEAVVTRLGHNGHADLLAERERELALQTELVGEDGAEALKAEWADLPAPISTYRGAGVGDTRSMVLRLYPEIDEEGQAESRGNRDVLVFSEGSGGRVLEFRFTEDDVIAEIVLRNPL